MLNRGVFALEIVRGLRKWPLKGGARLIEVSTSPGWTVYIIVIPDIYVNTGYN